MRSNFVVYIDFDSTLYNTGAFADDLWPIISKHAGVSLGHVKAGIASHYLHPALGGYDYEKHVMAYGLDPVEMWREVESLIQRTNYLYPDSAEFMQSLCSDGYHPKILTFGEERFQLAKVYPTLKYFNASHLFSKQDVIVVDRKKNEHINLYHSGQKGVLVDDKPDQQLPAGFTEIHINRSLQYTSPRIEGSIAVVSSLAQARSVITSIA